MFNNIHKYFTISQRRIFEISTRKKKNFVKEECQIRRRGLFAIINLNRDHAHSEMIFFSYLISIIQCQHTKGDQKKRLTIATWKAANFFISIPKKNSEHICYTRKVIDTSKKLIILIIKLGLVTGIFLPRYDTDIIEKKREAIFIDYSNILIIQRFIIQTLYHFQCFNTNLVSYVFINT